jgi:hypothetical protein
VNGPVWALAVSGSDVYAGGQFTSAGGTAADRVAKWNGGSWSALGSGVANPPYALAVSGSSVYAGGRAGTSGDATWLAQWDGSNWSALGSGVDREIDALAMWRGDLYAAGDFRNTGGNAARYIAKWNGGSWSALGSGVNGSSSALALSGSDLYVGGYFTTAGGRPTPYVARAYLLPLPTLSVFRSGTNVVVSWPSADTADFTLERAGKLPPPATWVPNAASVTDDGTIKSVTLPATNPAQFFRLRRP